MKNNIQTLVFLILSAFSYSQEIDTISRIDTTKTINLKEITLSSKLNKAGVYQLILPKKIIENETLDKTIKRVNFITIDNSKNLYFKGKKINNILFNDRPITIEEFNKLNLEDVKNIFIESNNFNQASGEIENTIKITEKKKIENNIKGSIDFSQGFFQQFNYYGLSLSNKLNKVSSRLQISNLENQTENESLQNINSNIINIENNRKLSQPYFSLQNIYDINNKNSFYIKNKYSIVDEKSNSLFSNSNNIDYKYKIKNYSLNIRHDAKFENNYLLKLNFDYINLINTISTFQSNNNSLLFSNQNFDELTFSPLLQKKGNKFEIVNSFVLTNRKYKFENSLSNNRINQNIFTYFVNYSYKINSNNSFLVGGRYQFEKNNVTNKKSDFFLPNITFLTSIDSIAEIEFNYKKRIQRPSVNSISNSIYYDNSGNEIINQNFLLPQIDNSLSLDIYKEIKKINLNFSLNYNFSKDYISVLYNFNNQILTNQVINVNDFNEKSIRTSLAIPLWKETKLNLNYSISKLQFTQNSNKINGTVNYYDASISGPIFKTYIFSVNSFYINRFYEYNAFYEAKPDFSFSFSTNYLKDKLNVNLEFRNVLNQDSNRIINFKESSNFYFQDSKNQSRLLLLSLTYNFGKNFKMSKKNIQNTNSDLKLK